MEKAAAASKRLVMKPWSKMARLAWLGTLSKGSTEEHMLGIGCARRRAIPAWMGNRSKGSKNNPTNQPR